MENLSIRKGATAERFYHGWSIETLGIKAGDQVDYYFEVWDNDGVSGAKSSRSQKP